MKNYSTLAVNLASKKPGVAAVALAAIFLSMAVSLPAQANEALAKSKNCMTCHGLSGKVIGPAYKDVAKKYASDKDAVAKLADKIIKGGTGVWGAVPMPPNSQVNPEEAKQLATWIMGLK